MKKLLPVIMAAVCVLSTVSAFAQSTVLDRIKKNKVIRVGVKSDYRPFGYVDQSGKIIGLEPSLAQDIAQRLGVKLELVPVQTANRIEFLQQGRIDLMIATMSTNDQRRKIVGVIEPFYYAGGTSFLAKKGSGFKNWSDLKGKDVCGVQGAYYNRAVAQKYGVNIVAFPGATESTNALLTGSCVGFIQDSTLHASMLASDPRWANYETPLPVEDYQGWAAAVPIEESNTDYGKMMRSIVTEWHATGFLIDQEKKWGLKPSEFLKEQHAKFKKVS